MKRLIVFAGLLVVLAGCGSVISEGEGEIKLIPDPGTAVGIFDQIGQALEGKSRQEDRMIDDPEAQTETLGEYVWAEDDATAQRWCNRIAERRGGRNARVERANSWSNKAGQYRYSCYYDVER